MGACGPPGPNRVTWEFRPKAPPTCAGTSENHATRDLSFLRAQTSWGLLLETGKAGRVSPEIPQRKSMVGGAVVTQTKPT